MHSAKSLVLAAILGLAACTSLKAPVFTTDTQAIRGYDPVAYFVSREPRKGKEAYTFDDGSATWYFENSSNRAAFTKNPKKFTPQYGGYCAYAMRKGLVVSTDPEAWTIENDRLFLNYSLGVRQTWLKNTGDYIVKADDRWIEKIK